MPLAFVVQLTGSSYESALLAVGIYVFTFFDFLILRQGRWRLEAVSGDNTSVEPENLFDPAALRILAKELAIRLALITPFAIILYAFLEPEIAFAIPITYLYSGVIFVYYNSVHVPKANFVEAGAQAQLFRNKKDVMLLVAGILTAFLGFCVMAFILFVTGFLPEWGESLFKESVLAYSTSLLLFQLALHWTLIGVSLYTIWRFGFKYFEVQLATVLHILHLAIAALWAYGNSALDSQGLAIILMALYLVVLVATMHVVRQMSEIGSYVLVQGLLVPSSYLYLIVIGVTT